MLSWVSKDYLFLSLLLWGVGVDTVAKADWTLPSFTSRPARRAVCSIQKETIYIDAVWTASDISLGISSGNGRGCDNAWRGKAKRRYWPLALEYSARKNTEVLKGNI